MTILIYLTKLITMSFDPTGITTALSDLFLLISKSLPSDEVRLARFKLRSPKKYARIQRSMLTDFVSYCKKEFNRDYVLTFGTITAIKEVTDYVTLETSDLPVSEQQLFIGLSLAEWQK